MEVVIVPSPEDMGRVVADAVEALVSRRPDAVLGLATGSSPLPVYDELVTRCRRGELSFARCRAFLLDEYVGLPCGHRGSYRAVIERTFTGRVDFPSGSVLAPTARPPTWPAACAGLRDRHRRRRGVDLQLLGLGSDGHIAFNEPGSSLGSRTRLKTLTARTRQDNARFFGSLDEVPRHVLTQGVATILSARHLVLVASGHAKAAPVAAALEGPVTRPRAGLGAAAPPSRHRGPR